MFPWLRCIGVQDEVIGAGLVAEALAIEIDFQPGLASHPEYHGSTTVGASQGVGRERLLGRKAC